MVTPTTRIRWLPVVEQNRPATEQTVSSSPGAPAHRTLRSMLGGESKWTCRHPHPDAFSLRSNPFRNFIGAFLDALNINWWSDRRPGRPRTAGTDGRPGPPPETGDRGWTSGTSAAQVRRSRDDTSRYGTHWSSGRPVRIEPRSRSPRPASTPRPGTPPRPVTCALASHSPEGITGRALRGAQIRCPQGEDDLGATVDQPGIP
jgi:hypothetical protein